MLGLRVQAERAGPRAAGPDAACALPPWRAVTRRRVGAVTRLSRGSYAHGADTGPSVCVGAAQPRPRADTGPRIPQPRPRRTQRGSRNDGAQVQRRGRAAALRRKERGQRGRRAAETAARAAGGRRQRIADGAAGAEGRQRGAGAETADGDLGRGGRRGVFARQPPQSESDRHSAAVGPPGGRRGAYQATAYHPDTI